MRDNRFLDTNILVYAYDMQSPDKQKKAQKILSDGIENENCSISVQVLGEFFNVVTKYTKNPMTPVEAKSIIDIFSVMPVVDIDLAMVKRAIDTHAAYRISYWDALIISAAERAECKQIYSEDYSHSQIYNGILVVNPFRQ